MLFYPTFSHIIFSYLNVTVLIRYVYYLCSPLNFPSLSHLFIPQQTKFKRKYNMFLRILLTWPDSFPPSSSWHQMLCKNVNVALVDYLCQWFYALNTLYGTCVTCEFWFSNEISKRRLRKCITDRADWTSSSVLHCHVTVAAWRRENTRDVGAAL